MSWAGESGASGSGLYVFTDDGSPDELVGEESQVVCWVDGSPKFVSQGALTGILLDLDNLADVSAISPASGDIIAWNNSAWELSTVDDQITKVFFNAYNSVDGIQFNSTATTIDVDVLRIQSPPSGFTLSASEVTVNAAAGPGAYRITYDVSADDNGGSRTKGNWWLELDSGSGFAEVAGTRRGTYHRNANQGEGSASATIIVMLSTNDALRIRGQVISGSDIMTLADGVSLTIERM